MTVYEKIQKRLRILSEAELNTPNLVLIPADMYIHLSNESVLMKDDERADLKDGYIMGMQIAISTGKDITFGYPHARTSNAYQIENVKLRGLLRINSHYQQKPRVKNENSL